MNPLADPECYGCQGTGRIVWANSANGRPCVCIPICSSCDEPFAWARDDEKPPRECPACVAATEAERCRGCERTREDCRCPPDLEVEWLRTHREGRRGEAP